MLFDARFKDSKDYEQFAFEQTTMVRMPAANTCAYCRKVETHWVDASFQLPICGEECSRSIWLEYQQESQQAFFREHMGRYESEIKQELHYVYECDDLSKDIIIVVHDQLDYLRVTINSLVAHTKNYHIYLWDNASQEPTQNYIKELSYQLGDKITVMRSDVNLGFIQPNNELASWGSGDYIILLNSDVKVFGGWDTSMLGYLQANPDTKLVGHMGGLLDADGIGGRIGYGEDIDYVPGWCLCLARETYDQFGLFNKDLKFAYAEDSELSLRIQMGGYKIYALHLMLVHHFENKTIGEVRKEKGEVSLRESFQYNHDILRTLWGEYLQKRRVDVRERLQGEEAFNELVEQLS